MLPLLKEEDMEELPQEDHPMEVLPEDQAMVVLPLEVLLMAELLPVDLLMEDRVDMVDNNNSQDTVVVGMVVELLPLLLPLVMEELPLEVMVDRPPVDTEVLPQLPVTVVLHPVDMEDNPLEAMVVNPPEVMVDRLLLLLQVTAVLLQVDMEVLQQAGMVDRLQADMLLLHEEDPREDTVDRLGADESPHLLHLEEDIKKKGPVKHQNLSE